MVLLYSQCLCLIIYGDTTQCTTYGRFDLKLYTCNYRIGGYFQRYYISWKSKKIDFKKSILAKWACHATTCTYVWSMWGYHVSKENIFDVAIFTKAISQSVKFAKYRGVEKNHLYGINFQVIEHLYLF